MEFPAEWESWNMIPEEWLALVLSSYESGMENASEHDRHGAFQWWLRNQPTTDQLVKLSHLSFLDPDQHMAETVRDYIRQSASFNDEVEAALSQDGE